MTSTYETLNRKISARVKQTVYGILIGDECGDNLSHFVWTDGTLRIDHDRSYEGFIGFSRGQQVQPEQVGPLQAYGTIASELTAAGFSIRVE